MQKTFEIKPNTARPCLSGPIVIVKESTLVVKFAIKLKLEMLVLRLREPSSAIQREREYHSKIDVIVR